MTSYVSRSTPSYKPLLLALLLTALTLPVFASYDDDDDYQEYQRAREAGEDVGGPNWKP